MAQLLNALPDAVLATRYRWFCRIGWKRPCLNHPLVINSNATPDDIDRLIQLGMSRWPTDAISALPPDQAA